MRAGRLTETLECIHNYSFTCQIFIEHTTNTKDRLYPLYHHQVSWGPDHHTFLTCPLPLLCQFLCAISSTGNTQQRHESDLILPFFKIRWWFLNALRFRSTILRPYISWSSPRSFFILKSSLTYLLNDSHLLWNHQVPIHLSFPTFKTYFPPIHWFSVSPTSQDHLSQSLTFIPFCNEILHIYWLMSFPH